MGYFLNKFGVKPIMEAEVDGEDLGDANQQDYTSSEEPSNQVQEDNTQEENTDQQQDTADEDTTNSDDNQEDGTTDYTEDDSTDDMDDTGTDDGASSNQSSGGQAEQPVDDIKKQEEELIGLTPTQLDIKHTELKNQYLNMFDIVISIIERLDDISIDKDTIPVIEYISDTLANLKTRLSDYVENVYSIKSYIENSINYNRFLAVLNGIQKILEEINKNNNN